MVGAPRPPAAQIRELHSRTSWFGHGPQTHTKTGRWNQVLIMATAWLAQRSQHEPAPRISCSIEPGGARARIGSCADPLMHAQKNHSPRVVDPPWVPAEPCLPASSRCCQAAHGHLPAAFGTTAAGGVSISPFPTWDLSRSLSRPALRASSDITIVFINQHATSAPGGFNVDGYNSYVYGYSFTRVLGTVHDKLRR